MTRAGGSITTDDGDDRATGQTVPSRSDPTRSAHTRPAPHRARLRFAFRSLILVACGAAMVVGSKHAWITSTYAHQRVTLDGTQRSITAAYGVNGWSTFAAGATLAGVGLVLTAWRAVLLKLVAFLAAFAGLGIAVYVLVRILHDMSQAHSKAVQATDASAAVLAGASIGYGLILVLAAAFVGLLVTLTDMDTR